MSKEIFKIALETITPDEEEVLLTQGIPRGTTPKKNILELYQTACELFQQLAEPIAIMAPISQTQFAQVYQGNHENETDTPLPYIYPRSFQLALLAATLGPGIGVQISHLMRPGNKDFPIGYMLDAVASYCMHKASLVAERHFLEQLAPPRDGLKVLLYSPGYCGWHISGQEKLFAYLQPAEIGITLNSSFLMSPLKSISGVLVAGPAFIHDFDNDYRFCSQCQSHSCRQRILR